MFLIARMREEMREHHWQLSAGQREQPMPEVATQGQASER